jgi:hypothetical protein
LRNADTHSAPRALWQANEKIGIDYLIEFADPEEA